MHPLCRRPLLDSAGLLTQVALAAIQVHDMALCRPGLEEAPVLRAGELLLEERGFINGAMAFARQHQRQVDGIIPRQAHMLATQEAISLATMADKRQPPLARAEQTSALVRGVERMLMEYEVPLNAWVSFWNTQKKCTDCLGHGR